MKIEYHISVEFAAADAAYNTWREGINLPREALAGQEPEVRQRWIKIAAAASAIPLMRSESNVEAAE